MTGGRPRTPIGAYGEISFRSTGTGICASARFRDLDGRLRLVQATARSQRAAASLLKERLLVRPGHGNGGVLRPASAFGDLCALWLADLEARDLNEGTKQNYRDDLRRYVLPVFEGYQLGEITTGRVEWFLRSEAAVSYSRARHSRTMLNLLFKFALRHDALPRNPVDGTSPLAKPHRTIQALTLEQVQAIRVAAAGWRTGRDVPGPMPDGKVRDVCEILLGTSMRPGEVLALRPCDITETRRGMVAHVQGTVVRRRGVADYRQEHPKTDASRRRIAVPQFAAQVIRERMAAMEPDQREVTLLHNRYGRVLTLNNTRRTFREFLADAGLTDSGITLRWYRRTGATVLARGLGLDAAAAFLGHTSNAITEGHYVAPDETVDMAPAEVLDRTLRSIDPDGALLELGGGDDEDDVLDEIDGPDQDDTAA